MWVGGVRVVVLDKDQRILMVCQKHEDRDIWMVPGGGIEDGETSMAAAVREVKEETGLDIEVEKLIWNVEQITKEGNQRFVNYFKANVIGGDLALGKDPEFSDQNQILNNVAFLAKDQLKELEHIHPEGLRDELWQVLEQTEGHYNPYKERVR